MDLKFENGDLVTVRRVDPYGYCGRELHPPSKEIDGDSACIIRPYFFELIDVDGSTLRWGFLDSDLSSGFTAPLRWSVAEGSEDDIYVVDEVEVPENSYPIVMYYAVMINGARKGMIYEFVDDEIVHRDSTE